VIDQAAAPGTDDGFFRQAGRSLLLAMYAALRSLKLYPVENATAQKSLDDLQTAAVQLLGRGTEVEVRLSGEFIFVNGTRLRLELDNFASFSHLHTVLKTCEIGVLLVHQGVERREWQIFLGVLLAVSVRADSTERYAEVRDRLDRGGVTRILVEPPLETEELKAEAERRVRAGECRADVARSLGIPVSTLRDWALKGGWRRKDIGFVIDPERGEAALAQLPEKERTAWRRFWADVEDLRRAQGAR